jgi:type IV pilus assembly protein PilO
MNLRLEKKHIIILLTAALLAVLLYVGAFFLYLSPMKDSLALKESQLKSEQQLSTTIEARLASANANDFSSTAEMQKMLPVDPMIEQLLLDLEKAEVVSNSYITSMEFSNEGQSGETAQPEAAQQESSTEVAQTESENQGTETVTPGESEKDLKMPEGLAKTSVTISVESDSYFDLEKFIETLEKLKRMVAVDSISFSGPEEINSLAAGKDGETPIKMTLTIHSFYLSGMDDLKDFNPKIETPEPANKRNPFPTFGDYSEDNLTEDETTDENLAEEEE